MTSSADASECEKAAIRAFLRGADDECITQWEAAHRAAVASDQPAEAARHGFWLEHISADLGGFVSAVFSMHDPEEVAGLLRGAGLHSVSSEVLTTTLDLPSPAEFLWKYIGLTPMATFIEQAAETARSGLETQFVSEAQCHVVDGVTAVELPMVVATGFNGEAVGNR
jgi:hypothetical protein